MRLLNIPNAIVTLNNVALPTPSKGGIIFGKNKIWSKNTGRSSQANMVGDIVAIKRTVDITWESPSESEVRLIDDIVSNIQNAFIPLSIYYPATDSIITMTVYSGDLKYTVTTISRRGATYDAVTLSLVEQ